MEIKVVMLALNNIALVLSNVWNYVSVSIVTRIFFFFFNVCMQHLQFCLAGMLIFPPCRDVFIIYCEAHWISCPTRLVQPKRKMSVEYECCDGSEVK